MTDIEQFYKICNASCAQMFSYSELEPLLNEKIFQQVGKDEKFSLKKLASAVKFEFIEQYSFWAKVLQQRSWLTPEELLNLWYTIVLDRSCPSCQKIKLADAEIFAVRNYREKISSERNVAVITNKLRSSDLKLLSSSVLTDDILIDHPTVINRYCQVRKKGFEELRYINDARRMTKIPMPQPMRSAIETDDVGAFMIYRDMTEKKLTYSLLSEVMQYGAVEIFSLLIEDKGLFSRVIPFDELAIYCTVQFGDDLSVKFLKSMEKTYPGSLKKVCDKWGRNLLWYAVFNKKTVFFHPFCKLTEFLLECGCIPDNENQIGLSWRYMIKNLTYAQKSRFLRRRHGNVNSWKPSPLIKEQPLYALADKSYEPQWFKTL